MKIFMSLMVWCSLASLAWASSRAQVKQGNDLFGQQKWDEAIRHYEAALKDEKHADITRYNLGSAFYKKGDYDQAIEYLQKVDNVKNPDLVSKSNYNLGNAFFQKGRSVEETNIDEALTSMQSSLSSYERTLNADPQDEDAAFNRHIVEEEIKRLQKKKEEQQQKQSSEDQKKDQSQKQQQPGQQPKDQTENKDQNQSQDQKQDQEKDQPKDQPKDRPSPQSKQAGKEHKEELKKKQAQEILNDYERQEAPKGLLNFIRRNQGETHVDKDW